MTAPPALLLVLLSGLAFAQAPGSDPARMLETAISDEKAGRIDAAVRLLHAILKSASDPEISGRARLELVRIHERRAEWWEAAEQLQALRKLAPQDAEYAYQLGVVYRSLSKAAFERMRSAAPQSARVEQVLGEQYAAVGDSRKAVDAYERAVGADPKLAGSHLALAVIYLREGKREPALAEIDKELQIAPESALARQIRQAITATHQ